MVASGLRIRLIEPAVGVVTGGSTLVIHGRGFRPQPHSLLVRFRLMEAADSGAAAAKVDVSGKFLLESQLEVTVPSFENEVKQIVASRTNLAQSSATITSAPQIVRVAVEVILDSIQTSNALDYCLHQSLSIRKISPQHVLMAPPTTITLTLNILKLPSRLATSAREQSLAEITSLPVFVRVKHKAERTGILSEQTRPGRWSVSSQGVFEVEFDAVMLGYGVASVEVTLNRAQFFRGVDKLPESFGYQVNRDALLESIDPCTIDVTSGRATDLRIFGTGFIDTGDLVVALAQRELAMATATGSTEGSSLSAQPIVTVAQLNATFVSHKEIHCSVQANMPFGLTTICVSPNGGKQFGNTTVLALLYRHRPLEEISPANGSLNGNTVVHIYHPSLQLELVDAMSQVQNLVPPRRVRLRFQALHDDGTPIVGLCKIINAHNFIARGDHGLNSSDRSAVVCRTPSFLDEMKSLQSDGRTVRFDHDGDVPLRVKRFNVSIALGSDVFSGALSFAYYFPPTIRSVTRHHGPATGGTSIVIRMKYKIPRQLPLLVRFLSLRTNKSQVVSAERFAEGSTEAKPLGTQGFGVEETPADITKSDDDPECLICCETPSWTLTEDLPHLTKIQVSYDGGVEFFPLDGSEQLMSPRTTRMADSLALKNAIARDWSYLYFLFYKTPSFNAVLPMSADIQGGSSIRIMGENIIDHGAQVTVVFHSPRMSRKVLGFIEKGEVRCCAPPFDVGPVAVYVSFNSEQYTKCSFKDPESNQAVDFVFYSSPSIRSISPLCASVSKSSVISIFGVNLIETGRIKVRIAFATPHGKFIHKDVPGKARDGVITAASPTFSSEFANTSAVVDVALNGNDFTGTTTTLHYFSSYQIQRIEPRIGAAEIPIAVSLQISPSIVTDRVVVCLRLKLKTSAKEATFGPVEVAKWASDRVTFTLPALVTFAETVDAILNVFVDVSFDGVSFHTVGDLLTHYKVYNMPHLTSMSPLYGLFNQDTEIMARGACLQLGDTVKISLFLQNALNESSSSQVAARTQIPVAVIVGEANVKRQTLMWRCPRLAHVCSSTWTGIRSAGRMVLDEYLTMQISVVDGQAMTLPFKFRYYRTPTLVAMDPCIGYTCSGSVISFEFKESIETPTVDFRFGQSEPSGGRLREGRFIECFSPEVEKGVHEISVSFNEQHFETLCMTVDMGSEDNDEEDVDGGDRFDTDTDVPSDEEGRVDSGLDTVPSTISRAVTFEAFPLPVFMVPRNSDRLCGFGPLGGGANVLIKGLGFVPGTRIYVRFCSPYRDGLGEGSSDVVVKAAVVDAQTIQCSAPPSLRAGRVGLHVSYNLQQFIDSTCFFDYHCATAFEGSGTLCGPVSGKTPVSLVVQSENGLPVNKALIECSIRFSGRNGTHSIDVPAAFNPESLTISCVAPAWPSNELVSLLVTLTSGPFEQFVDSHVQYLFYDPPEGVIRIEPCAGPISGGTNVLAWCGKLVDTGEIMICITLNHVNPGMEERGDIENADGANLGSGKDYKSILVKGTIIGDAVSFVTPPVDAGCTAFLNISLNGINYTAIQQSQSLKYVYYVNPVIRRVFPLWYSAEAPSDVRVSGENIHDYGCRVLIRLVRQSSDSADSSPSSIVADGRLIRDPVDVNSSLQVEASIPVIASGFYEVEVSLNGQQFSNSHYMSAHYGNFSGVVCTSLLPLRVFAAPFFLATSTGPAAGGSTVVLFFAKKLLKLFAKETKCSVQFTPLRPSGETPLPLGLSASSRNSTSLVLDPVTVQAEIDHPNSRATCRAPLLRVACVAAVDILLPASSDNRASVSQMFNSKEKEKYYSYESPTITEIFPSCGPVSGNTWLVIEATNVIDTGQIFVRFRSTTNERECAIIPGTYSRRFPDGSLSCSPLIVCRTPEVEFVDKVIVDPGTTPLNGAAAPVQTSASSGTAGSLTRRSKELAVGKARAQMFQTMAGQSVNARSMGIKDGGAKFKSVNTLRLTHAQSKTGSASATNSVLDLALGATVLVDFTLNAGEQFIAHSVKFYYYGQLDASEIKWSPRHLPTKSLSRASAQARSLTVQLPKAFRLNDFPDRICFRFDGNPQPVLSKRRGSSIILHETSATRELLMLDAPKLRSQATARRRSTISRNSSMSASSTSLLSMSTPPNSLLSAPTPPSLPRSKQLETYPLAPSRTTTTNSPAPFIAGKAIGTNEVSCPVPDFSTDGPVKVFISLNAQQFVCLGDLHFHSPIAIAEDEHFRFCSSVGGNRFTVCSSVSSVLRYVSPENVTNEVNRSKEEFANVFMKPSKTLQHSLLEIPREHLNDSNPEQCDDSITTELFTGVRWKKRVFCAFHVVLVPPNPSVLLKVSVKATRPDSVEDMGNQTPDSNGCCVFEVTDWVSDMALRAELAPEEGYCPYSYIARRDLIVQSEWSTTSSRFPIILVQRLTIDRAGVALFAPAGSASPKLHFRTGDGGTLRQKAAPNVLSVHGGMIEYAEVTLEALSSERSPNCYVCVEYPETPTNSSGGGNDQTTVNETTPALNQILISYQGGICTGLVGEARGTGVWAVAGVQIDTGVLGSLAVTPIDSMLSPGEDVEGLGSLRANADAVLSRRRSEQSAVEFSNIPIRIHFSPADSSVNLSASASAKLVLGGETDTREFFKSTVGNVEVKVECSMPSLPFSGPTNVMVSFGGVMFSNFICIHCYDPRAWTILAVYPACGLLRKPVTIRIKGENFVETNKILVRFADERRYFTVTGSLARSHLLILRIAAVKNLRALLGSLPNGVAPNGAGALQRDEDKMGSGATDIGIQLPPSFTLTVRVECDAQKVFASCRDNTVTAAMASGSSLSWEEQFEIQVASKQTSLLVIYVELVDSSLPKPVELARGVLQINTLQEGTQRRRSVRLERHFHRGLQRSKEPTSSLSLSEGEIDLVLHLSPLMLQPECIVCSVDGFSRPEVLSVQVSPGGNLFPSLPVLTPLNSFQVYELPVVTNTSPRVLPRSAGGEIVISGAGFIDVDKSGRVRVRLFCCLKHHFTTEEEERRVLFDINHVSLLQQIGGGNFFIRDIEGTVKSSSAITCVIPPSLASYNIFYRLSFDGREFTEASECSHLLLFSVYSIDPKGGPISGNTYAALNGVNISACLSPSSMGTPLSSLVRLSWMRGTRELESVVVAGEFYPPDDTIYFYTPQSRFGLQNIAVTVELALVSNVAVVERVNAVVVPNGGITSDSASTSPRFSRDEISFIMYKVPVIRGVSPATSLMPGFSSLELAIQGFDEKSTRTMKSAFKVRFKQRGQMQVADVLVASEIRFDCLVPRFNINRAVATEVSVTAALPTNIKRSPTSPRNKVAAGASGSSPTSGNPRCLRAPQKIWTRTCGIFVVLLGARNLRVSKKHTCNPFAILTCEKVQLKSTRKDATFSPVWNEMFDFAWPTPRSLSSNAVRIVLENQLTLDQSEFIGQIELKLDDQNSQLPAVFRAWLPLRRLRGKTRGDTDACDSRQSDNNRKIDDVAARLGEIEVAFAFIPPLGTTRPKEGGSSSATSSLRSSILSVISNRFAAKRQGIEPAIRAAVTPAPSRKERLLRAFKHRGPPMSLIPTELQIELALNGQDFWSAAPIRCYTLPPPIVLAVEPAYISIAGGTITYVSGLNFVNSGNVRVAFVSDYSPLLHNSQADGNTLSRRIVDQVVIVDAKYRSSTSLVCVSPTLTFPGGVEATTVKVFVCLNGVDFDSVALPRQSIKLCVEGETELTSNTRGEEKLGRSSSQTQVGQREVVNQENAYIITIALENDQYVANLKTIEGPLQYRPPLDYHVRVYQIPKIVCVRPTDGTYTSHLTFDGSNFTNTGIAIARFTSTSDIMTVKTSRLEVKSATQMSCSVPDFQRGTVVRIEVSMNGVEFVPYAHELCLFQQPRLSEIVPNWISANSTSSLLLRGINITAAATSSSPNAAPTVYVFMARGPMAKSVSAVCMDGEAHCSIPHELLSDAFETQNRASAATNPKHDLLEQELEVRPPITIDIRLGGAKKELSGKPILLRIYRTIPVVSCVSPMDGPVYGVFSIVVDGKGFVNTGSIVVRFQFFPLQTSDEDGSSASASKSNRSTPRRTKTNAAEEKRTTLSSSQISSDLPAFVDVPAKYISAERILCPAPMFPQEGVYVVLVALNGVEFTAVNETTWFLAWQNWQKRKQLLAHDLFAAPRLAREIAVSVASPRNADTSAAMATTIVGTLDEDEVERLRRKTTFMLPQIKGASRPHRPEPGSLSSTRSFNPLQEDELEEDLAELVNPRLLHWHPSSAADEKGQPLLTLLDTLCNSRESQKIICRRLRIVFRMKGVPRTSLIDCAELKDENGHDRSDVQGRSRMHVSAFEITYSAFVQGMRLIFPHALERDLESLWSACEGTESGRLTYESLMAKVMRPVPNRRCGSPEPGPTHYSPQLDIISPRAPAAVVLPQVSAPEVIAGLPSELFINYETAYKAVKPSTPGTVFRKRRFNTSWCNPVQPDESTAVRAGGRLLDESVAASGSVSLRSLATSTPHPPQPSSYTDPPLNPTATSAADASVSEAFEPSATVSETASSKESATRLPNQVWDTHTLQAIKTHELGIPTDNGGYRANSSPPAALQSGGNLFYNDIAPMYLRFLRSKEIQKLVKLAEDDNDSDNHPATHGGLLSREKR